MIDDDRQISANHALSREQLLSTLQGTIGEGILVKLERVLGAFVAANTPATEPEVILWKWGNAATYVDEKRASYLERSSSTSSGMAAAW